MDTPANTSFSSEQAKQWVLKHRRELASGAAGFGLLLVIWLVFFSLPKPKLTDPPRTTRESAVSLTGKTKPHVAVIAYDASGTAMMFANANDEGNFTLEGLPVGEGETMYVFRALDGGWRASSPLKVRITKDTTAPALQINPFDQAVVTGSNTTISGTVEPGSVVTVNGVKTEVAADGSWSSTIALQSGKNAVTVSATDPAGNTTTYTQTIQYTPTDASSPTGTISISSTTSSVSPGSLPAPTSTTPTATSTDTTPTGTTNPTSPTTSPTSPESTTPPPPPQPILGITSTAWVSISSPNERATETVYVSVKDNYGKPVTAATVTASVYFQSGVQTYTLSSLGNGTYTASFKLNDRFVAGYRVNVQTTATYNGFTSSANAGFTPR